MYDIDLNGGNSSYIIKYNKDNNNYSLTSQYYPISVKDVTPELLDSYYLEDYPAVFEDYNEAEMLVLYYGDDGAHPKLVLKAKLNKESLHLNGIFLFYTFRYELHLRPFEFPRFNYIDMRKNQKDVLMANLNQWYENEEGYKKCNIRHARSALLYGPPGNGKTLEIMQCVQEMTNKYSDIVTIFMGPDIEVSDLLKWQAGFEDKKKIIVIEEITTRMKEDSDNKELLSFLDGEYSWDNIFVIATTNNPEQLSKSVVGRPGRFEDLIFFDNPDYEEREKFIEAVGLDPQMIEYIAGETKDFSLDHLSKLVIHSKINNQDVKEYLKKYKKYVKLLHKNFDSKRGNFGILGDD